MRRSEASSSVLVVAEARRRPSVTVTVTDVSSVSPDVLMLASAKRVLPPVRADDRHAGLIGRRAHLQHAIGQRARLLAREQPSARRVGPGAGLPGAHAVLAVLRIRTLRKRAGTQPWLTELLCDGSPLPSLKAPPTQYDDLPPIMSMAFQKSGVRA